MVTSDYNRVVMERNDDVDELIVLPQWTQIREHFGSRLREYDVAIALAPRAVDLQLIGATRAPLRVGYTYERRWFARLTARLYVNRIMISEADPELCDRDPHRIVRHEVVQLLDLVALAGAHRRVLELRLDVTDADRAARARFAARSHRAPSRAALVHGRQHARREPLAIVEGLAALAPVVVTCARECEAMAPAFERNAALRDSLRGLPFHQWAAVLERARVVVTVDTGATHVASAVHRPTRRRFRAPLLPV